VQNEIPTVSIFSPLAIFILVSFLAFIYYSSKIYINSYTFTNLIKWFISYLMLISVDLILKPTLITVLFFSNILLTLMNMFFLLRIEERGYTSSYGIGFCSSFLTILILNTYILSSSYQSKLISLFNNTYFILSILFVVYCIKMLYNKTMRIYIYKNLLHREIKTEKIRYPIILLALLISIFLINALENGIYNSFWSLMNLISLIFAFFAIFYFIWAIEWFSSSSNENDVTHTRNENYFWNKISDFENKMLNIQHSIPTSKFELYGNAFDAIYNTKNFDIKNFNKKELQFMLICANQIKNDIEEEYSSSLNFILAGVGLIILPFIRVYGSLLDYSFYLSLTISNIIPGLFEKVITPIMDYLFALTKGYSTIIVIYFIFTIFAIFSSLNVPNSKTNIWIHKHKMANILYGLIFIIFIILFVIKWLQSNEIDREMIENLSLFFFGLIFILTGRFSRKLFYTKLNNSKNFILDLNHRIIFSED
jgi:hypothetical protein